MKNPKKKTGPKKKNFSITDAVDNLTSIVQADSLSTNKNSASTENKSLKRFQKLSSREKSETIASMKQTFKTVHNYLKHVYNKGQDELKDRDVQRGVNAIMVLADEAANKLQSFSDVFSYIATSPKEREFLEYKHLKKYFKKKIIKRFEQVLDSEAKWHEQWIIDDNLNVEKQGLRDFEMVKRDKNYELFYIRKNDGTPLFNRNLLRHIKLVSDFDELIKGYQGEDPLFRINILLDHEAQDIAEQIKENSKKELEDFYHEANKHKEIPMVSKVIKATVSLMLASSSKNSIDSSPAKVCTRYLVDFHRFLREILESKEYKKINSVSIVELDKLTIATLKLIHAFSYAFFAHNGKKNEMLDYLKWLIEKALVGYKFPEKEGISTDNFLSLIYDINDHVTRVLKNFPSGPLFKTLDIFQERGQKEGFDPINQGNSPSLLYTLELDDTNCNCLKIPCPTIHTFIDKAKIVPEFLGFLKSYSHESKKKLQHLHFNLQDSTTWEEHARCDALKILEKNSEFSGQLILITLPKKSDFYNQLNEYKKLSSSSDFIATFLQQIESREECGFYFSKKMKKDLVNEFTVSIFPLIHQVFFKNKIKISREERLDFIEIFYLFLQLKFIDIIRPKSFSFSCKDCVDYGALTSAYFFSTCKYFSKKDKWSKTEQEHFMWILQGPALIVRERLIDYNEFSRMASALTRTCATLIKKHDQFKEHIAPLFTPGFFENISVDFE